MSVVDPARGRQFGFGKERETLMVKTEPIGITQDKWSSFKELMEAVKSTIGAPDVSVVCPTPRYARLTSVCMRKGCPFIRVFVRAGDLGKSLPKCPKVY